MPGHPVLDPDLAPVSRNKHPTYREPKSLAPPHTVFSLESEKNRLLRTILDARSRICNGDDDSLLIPIFDCHHHLNTRSAMLHDITDQVHEDLRQEVVSDDLSRLPPIVDTEVREVSDLIEDHSMEIDGGKPNPALVDPPDGGDVCRDLNTLSDSILQLLGVQSYLPLELSDEDVSVDVRDVIGVFDVVGEYIQVEVRLPVRRLKLVVEYPAQDTSPDLPSDRLEEPALAGGEESSIPAANSKHPDGL